MRSNRIVFNYDKKKKVSLDQPGSETVTLTNQWATAAAAAEQDRMLSAEEGEIWVDWDGADVRMSARTSDGPAPARPSNARAHHYIIRIPPIGLL